MTEITTQYQPTTQANEFDRLWQFAQVMSKSNLLPKEFHGNPENTFIALQMCQDRGLGFSAIQNVAVVNGRLTIWGDLPLALAQRHQSYEWIKEHFNESKFEWTCTVKRKNHEPHTQTYNLEDAKAAGLTTRDTYKKDAKRMLQMRARQRALRDAFADVLAGIANYDISEIDQTPSPIIVNDDADEFVEPEQTITVKMVMQKMADAAESEDINALEEAAALAQQIQDRSDKTELRKLYTTCKSKIKG